MKDEKGYVEDIEKYLIPRGFKILKEVWSTDKKNRIDLIIYRQDLGYIGIECKHNKTIQCGGVTAKAIKQIMRYKDSEYPVIGKIERWGVCFKRDYRDDARFAEEHEVFIFVSMFVKEFGVDFIEYRNYRSEWKENGYFIINPNTQDVIKI